MSGCVGPYRLRDSLRGGRTSSSHWRRPHLHFPPLSDPQATTILSPAGRHLPYFVFVLGQLGHAFSRTSNRTRQHLHATAHPLPPHRPMPTLSSSPHPPIHPPYSHPHTMLHFSQWLPLRCASLLRRPAVTKPTERCALGSVVQGTSSLRSRVDQQGTQRGQRVADTSPQPHESRIRICARLARAGRWPALELPSADGRSHTKGHAWSSR